MTAAQTNSTTRQGVLHLAFELGWGEWKLAFSTGPAETPWVRTIKGRDLNALHEQIAKAKRRFNLAGDATVRSCYEAGRDGFWLHRYLTKEGIANLIVDSSSIEVDRRMRRAKSDRLDALKLVGMLLRWHGGEKKVWKVVRVPSVADEDGRQLHRELQELKDERTMHVNRVKGLLASQGLETTVDETFPDWLRTARLWDGSPLSGDQRGRLQREFERWQFVGAQIRKLENERTKRIRRDGTPHVTVVRRLLGLRGIGLNGAWFLVHEMFGWRQFKNRKQVGSSMGGTPTPYDSGKSKREQGISKAGNRRLRKMMVELAWCWMRYQPHSALSRWYAGRFGGGPSRLRKIGIVAVARKLLIALWRYGEREEVPAGASVIDWKEKLGAKPRKGGGGGEAAGVSGALARDQGAGEAPGAPRLACAVGLGIPGRVARLQSPLPLPQAK